MHIVLKIITSSVNLGNEVTLSRIYTGSTFIIYLYLLMDIIYEKKYLQ